MHTVGTKELKDRLTHYLRLVRQGTTFIVTDRGRPVGILKPVSGEETGETEDLLAGLAAEGHVSLPRGRGFLKKPPAIQGKGLPLSQVVLEGRR
ncbi:MAG TPA: type II toxin-antitoxin system prevent-host-death family antitoxin [Candidatus Binatia bacterium]|jgi:prevent-host-death family protein|nr:type II toxin-antitoxin system prevent-host-death family antitoxin [Candidatus Binatia bacterium]